MAAISTLIIAISIFQLANGFFGTLVSLRVSVEEFSVPLGGLILSSYYAGYTVGAVRCGRIIERIGHIRAFAVFAGLIASAVAVMPVAVSEILWIVARAAIGFGAAGLFITAESWLNAKTGPENRGKVFSIYMVGTFAALGAGQLLISGAAILILGESSTGKGLFARALHNGSNRKERPLIKVDCAGLPANLIESEFFGHEKGAFTGAVEKRIGRFELADGATLFLDEIGELPLALQQKQLRGLQDGEFERLGSSQVRKTDVRVIAATNRNFKEDVSKGRFRYDLWYRLNVFPLSIPPLR